MFAIAWVVFKNGGWMVLTALGFVAYHLAKVASVRLTARKAGAAEAVSHIEEVDHDSAGRAQAAAAVVAMLSDDQLGSMLDTTAAAKVSFLRRGRRKGGGARPG